MPARAPTRSDILRSIKALGKRLGRAPSRPEWIRHARVSGWQVVRHFGSWSDAIRSAGLAPRLKRSAATRAELLEDWGRVVRKLRAVPSATRYTRAGAFDAHVLRTRIARWRAIPAAFCEHARSRPEWADVVAIAAQPCPPRTTIDRASPGRHDRGLIIHTRRTGVPTLGPPVDFRGLRHEPDSEAAVVLLFGMLAEDLGYRIEKVQAAFPDCIALRRVGAAQWQRVRIEFEFNSLSFKQHRHDPAGCEVLVCWRHDWKACPPGLEVVELSSVVAGLRALGAPPAARGV